MLTAGIVCVVAPVSGDAESAATTRFEPGKAAHFIIVENRVATGYASDAMSKTEILTELPKLAPRERREIVRRIFELEDDAQVLSDADRRADERFHMLDDLESGDGKTQAQ
jgi:hypothetical protein